jgi:hypothetical protein
MHKRFLLPMLVGSMLGQTWATTARAEAPQKAAAEALFQSGRALVEQGDHAAACERFEGSLELEPALGTRLHLADCYERIGKVASAWATFEEAASIASVSGQPERETIARTRAEALAARLSKIEVRVPQDARVAGLEIRVAGVVIPEAAWGTEWPLDPGKHAIVASAPGYEGWRTDVSVLGGAKRVVVGIPRLEPTIAARPPNPPAPAARRVAILPPAAPSGDAGDESESGDTQQTLGIVTLAVGVAGLAAGGVLGVQAIRTNDESLDACRPDDASRCTPEGVELREQAQDYALGSTIALGAGGAVALTGFLLILTSPDDPVADIARSVSPAVSSTGASWTMGGAW